MYNKLFLYRKLLFLIFKFSGLIKDQLKTATGMNIVAAGVGDRVSLAR